MDFTSTKAYKLTEEWANRHNISWNEAKDQRSRQLLADYKESIKGNNRLIVDKDDILAIQVAEFYHIVEEWANCYKLSWDQAREHRTKRLMEKTREE